MPLVNHSRRELHVKLVYYGPGLGGKTTNLEFIHGHTRPENRGKLISLQTEAERTLFFDLLPMELGTFRGYRVRMHLCTVPGQIALDTTRQLVLKNVDGVVFVVDSQAGRIDDNIESMRNLEVNLLKQGIDPDDIPKLVQLNKRDLPDAMPRDELLEQLDVEEGTPVFEAVAIEGKGVFETFKTIAKTVLRGIGAPESLPEGRTPSILPGRRASSFPGSAPPAASVTLPSAPKVPRLGDNE